MSNKFANAFKQKEQSSDQITMPTDNMTTTKSKNNTSRSGTKHIGGYFDPVVSKQLRTIALDEDSSVQSLIAEALDMLFQSRGKPMIAEKSKAQK